MTASERPFLGFDLAMLSRAIDDKRAREHVSFAELSRAVGVAAATIRRFAVASDAEADGVLALVRWLDVAPEVFVHDSTVVGEKLPQDCAMVRADFTRISELEGRTAARQSRVTIQRLAASCQGAGVAIASVTRASEF